MSGLCKACPRNRLCSSLPSGAENRVLNQKETRWLEELKLNLNWMLRHGYIANAASDQFMDDCVLTGILHACMIFHHSWKVQTWTWLLSHFGIHAPRCRLFTRFRWSSCVIRPWTRDSLTHLPSTVFWATGKVPGLGGAKELLWAKNLTRICCCEKNKFCCLFKHFQTRLTISIRISVGWCQCFCSVHVIMGGCLSLWKKKHLSLKLKGFLSWERSDFISVSHLELHFYSPVWSQRASEPV